MFDRLQWQSCIGFFKWQFHTIHICCVNICCVHVWFCFSTDWVWRQTSLRDHPEISHSSCVIKNILLHLHWTQQNTIIMSLSAIQTKTVGVKKQVTNCLGTVDNIRDLDLSKSFMTGQVCHSCDVLCKFHSLFLYRFYSLFGFLIMWCDFY